ncbi:phage tail protein [uncultured Massilia sp.]|uniref:phage tail protein n=1 Tax=uncultured Massilia sp. TaxID=169973 RepID=UPI0025D509D5|nr:phage tail protein [uncultured Massilia sp.]
MTLPPSPSRLAAACLATLCALLPATAQACGSAPYSGSICTFPFRKCPVGYLEANGAVLTIAQHPVLGALIGNIFGGDGKTTFALPDLRARTMVGTGAGAGLQPVLPGQAFGRQKLALDSNQAPLQAHTHAATFAPTTKQVEVKVPASAGDLKLDGGLPVSPDSTKATALPTGPVYLSGFSAKVGPTQATLSGPYTAVQPGTPAASSVPVDITTSGTSGTPAVSTTVDTVTGGTVTLAASATAAAAQPLSTQAPGLGMVICVAETGIYPTHDAPSQIVTDTQ